MGRRFAKPAGFGILDLAGEEVLCYAIIIAVLGHARERLGWDPLGGKNKIIGGDREREGVVMVGTRWCLDKVVGPRISGK